LQLPDGFIADIVDSDRMSSPDQPLGDRQTDDAEPDDTHAHFHLAFFLSA
jgi:hypothetical protein